MKMRAGMGRKLRYGGVTAALTAAIIAIIIIVNVIFSALAHKQLWYTDLTPELLFTLSENCITLMNEGDAEFAADGSTSPIKKIDEFRAEAVDKAIEAAKASAEEEGRTLSDEELATITEDATKAAKEDIAINIIFCDIDLNWEEDTAQRYVLETANQLQEEFPEHINIEFVDIIRNPTAVTKYGSSITTSSVIVERGTEYRIHNLKSFYVFDDTTSDEEPWAYNGEKMFAASILAVTRAVTPVACITTGHGEQLPSASFLQTIFNAGYEIKYIDLAYEDIPADCRLLIISSPQDDFLVDEVVESEDGGEEKTYQVVDEIDKIDKFLDGNSALMMFMDPTLTKSLPYLEEYLEEWGIKYDRVEVDAANNVYEPYRIKDITQSLDEYGYNIRADYVDFGLGAEISNIVSELNRKIVFPETMSISYSDKALGEDGAPDIYFEDQEAKTGALGKYAGFYSDGAYREMFDIFVSGENAVAEANGGEVETAKNGNLFKLMTVTVEGDFIQESNYTTTETPSYVFAMGCNAFYSDQMLSGQYGNNMFLESTLRIIGHEPVPVGLTFKPFGDYTIDTVEAAQATIYTVVFTVVPLVLAAGVGIFVIVRRKNR